MKDLSEPPEALILTMPKAFFDDREMSFDEFRKEFEDELNSEDGYWNFLKMTLPIHDVQYVYIVFDSKIQYRVTFVCYERNKTKAFADSTDGKVRHFPNKNWIIIGGPCVKAPYDIPMKGFQGHRYTKKLF